MTSQPCCFGCDGGGPPRITFDKKSMFPDDNTPGLYIHYRPVQPMPETIALAIGDAVHNLRAALDHLATGIV